MASKPQIIPPDAYPQMVPKAHAAKLAGALRGREATIKGIKMVAAAGADLRAVVRSYVETLERCGSDDALLNETVHEIKGLAETAGLAATGRIAESLCRYLDQLEVAQRAPEAAVVMLHVSAIVRAARLLLA